jgi:hypothetical protein
LYKPVGILRVLKEDVSDDGICGIVWWFFLYNLNYPLSKLRKNFFIINIIINVQLVIIRCLLSEVSFFENQLWIHVKYCVIIACLNRAYIVPYKKFRLLNLIVIHHYNVPVVDFRGRIIGAPFKRNFTILGNNINEFSDYIH